MSKKTKSFIYNLIGFGTLFFLFIYLFGKVIPLESFWVKLIAFVVATVLSPKFQAVRTKDGERLFMKWIFIKGIKVLE